MKGQHFKPCAEVRRKGRRKFEPYTYIFSSFSREKVITRTKAGQEFLHYSNFSDLSS